VNAVLRVAGALAFAGALAAQGTPAPQPTSPAAEPGKSTDGTTTTAPLPELGPPAPLPDGAPKHLALIEREGLRKHAYWLADDARQGRYTSSKTQLETANYIAAHFQKLGLKPLGDKKSFVQSYPLDALALDTGTQLQVGTVRIAENFAVLPSKDLDKLALSGKLAWCGHGRTDELPESLKGRIALVVLDKQPRGTGVSGDLGAVQRYGDIAKRLAKAEAQAAVVVLLGDPAALGNGLNYQALSPDHPSLGYDAPGRVANFATTLFVVGGPSAQKLLQTIGALDETGSLREPTAIDKAPAKLTIALKRGKANACNVVALLEGKSKKAEAVVFSAHHDHVGLRVDGDAFNGADDNASGSSGLLEIAEAFAKGGDRPARSILFVSVSGEELGLFGSRYFSEHPTWPLDKIVADVNIDMIGRCAEQDGKTVIQITPSFAHPKYSSIARSAAQLAKVFDVTLTSGDQYYERSDHYNFAQKGVPVVFFCDGEHPDYHQVTDSPDRLDYPRMETIARMAFWTGWQVAEAKDRPTEIGVKADW
jgi:Peptidase family M28